MSRGRTRSSRRCCTGGNAWARPPDSHRVPRERPRLPEANLIAIGRQRDAQGPSCSLPSRPSRAGRYGASECDAECYGAFMLARQLGPACLLVVAACQTAVADTGAPKSKAGQDRQQKVGGVLTITLATGAKVVLQDVHSESMKIEPALHEYIEFLPRLDQHLVSVTEYEGYHYLLIDDRTGAKTVIAGKPVLSPGGKRFACRMVNMVIGFARVEVWEISGRSFRLEFKYEPEGIPGSIDWKGEDSIGIDLVDAEEKTVLGHESLRRGRRGWEREGK